MMNLLDFLECTEVGCCSFISACFVRFIYLV